MSFIAPVCNATYCKIILDLPFVDTLMSLITEMVPTAFLCVLCAIGLATLVPQRVCRLLSRHQFLIPATVNSILFSLYFSMLGYGLVRGSVSIFGWRFTYYVLAPAVIVGVGTLLHIIVRPYRRELESDE